MKKSRLGSLTLFIFILKYAIYFLSTNAIAADTQEIFVPTSIKLENGSLSVFLEDTELKDVLEEISRQGEIKFVMEKPIKQKLTMEFKNLPLEKGLKKLLEGTDYYIVFSGDKSAPPHAIKEINIIPRSSETRPSDTTISMPSPFPPTTSSNPFIEALRSAKEKGEGRRELTPEQKKTIIETFSKGSEENKKRAEELLKILEEGTKEEKK